MAPESARRAVGSVCVWHLRVLAGWLPPRGGDVVRVFAGRFELANIADRLAALAGEQVPEPYALGALGAAWPRVAAASTPAQVRSALTSSGWGDPGSVELPDALIPLEARWSSWLGDVAPGASRWAAGASALVVARQIAARRPVPAEAAADLHRQLGRAWETASDLGELADRLPPTGAWPLDDLDDVAGLWRAEGRWWRRVDRDAAATLRTGRPGPAVVAAAAAALVADSWRVQAALEAAGWGRIGLEVFDAVA
jgi:hypothetical protein